MIFSTREKTKDQVTDSLIKKGLIEEEDASELLDLLNRRDRVIGLQQRIIGNLKKTLKKSG
jgi:hypothetical protein